MLLAYMPQSPPLPNFHNSDAMGSSTMSLTILPSTPKTYSQQAIPPVGPSPSKRPKLTLNTSDVSPVYGKGSTSLRLETLSATSPTARNTFRNTQSPRSATRLRRPALRPLTTDVESPSTPSLTPSRIELPDSASTTPADLPSSSAASATSVSTLDSLPAHAPYKLPFNAQSILINGPIQRTKSRRLSFSQSRPMFPTPKKVGFRAPLEEEIENTIYTMRHSDILSPSSEGSKLELSPPKKGVRKDASDYQEEGAKLMADNVASPTTRTKREVDDEEDESDVVPATPVAGRRKKDRAWRWTLGPISPSQASEEDMVNE